MEEEIIALINENGEEEEFYVLASFGVNENNYAAIISVEDEEDLIHILEIEESYDGELILKGIDDQDELDQAIEVFNELIEENDIE